MRIDEITQRVTWHASYTKGIKQFRFLTHLGTWTAAAERALQKDFSPTGVDLNYLTVYMYQVDMSGCRQGIQIQDDSNATEPLDHITDNWERLPQAVRAKLNHSARPSILKKRLPDAFAELGIDYLWYYNRVESPGSKSFVVLNPSCFVITGVEKFTPADLLRADPRIMDNMVRRGIWPARWAIFIKKFLKQWK